MSVFKVQSYSLGNNSVVAAPKACCNAIVDAISSVAVGSPKLCHSRRESHKPRADCISRLTNSTGPLIQSLIHSFLNLPLHTAHRQSISCLVDIFAHGTFGIYTIAAGPTARGG